jgi:hypothetical protein
MLNSIDTDSIVKRPTGDENWYFGVPLKLSFQYNFAWSQATVEDTWREDVHEFRRASGAPSLQTEGAEKAVVQILQPVHFVLIVTGFDMIKRKFFLCS